MYEAGDTSGDVWADETDLLDAITEGIAPAALVELGVDPLPDGIEDIRGRIQSESDRVFAWLDEWGNAQYTGIVALAT
jgi:hypothetical protein